MVPMAMASVMTGKTMLRDDRALLPTNREIKIPSTMVYSDMNVIMMMDGAANFNKDHGVNEQAGNLCIFKREKHLARDHGV